MTTASTRLDWLTHASCAARPEVPWTADSADVTAEEASRMHEVCQSCPVVQECAAAADQWRVTAGWWAGRSRDVIEPQVQEPAWVPVTVGRCGRVVPGARQGVFDFGDAA